MVTTAILCLALAWFGVRWQLGNMLAALTPPGDPNAAQISDLAIGMAPSDPTAAWLKATSGIDDRSIEGDTSGIRLYENAVRLAPHDYRWRVELGRALEQDEQSEKAEIELKRAIELAPAYAHPRWTLGNFYLRHDRNDEALAEFKRAAENNETYRDQVFSLIWDFFGKDPSIVESIAGERPEAHARLAYFFAARGRGDDALRNWNLLTDAEKAANPVIAKSMAQGLYSQRVFPEALEFSRQIGFDSDAVPEAVTDGSFERGVAETTDSRFGWRVARNDPKLEIAADAKVKHDGNRSLRVTFKNYVKTEFYNVFQTVVVVPGKKYRLEFWVRTENLRGMALPQVDVINANDDKLIVRSQPFASGTTDWQKFTLDFDAPQNCSGITIRTVRFACGDDCPIAGIFWFDNFELTRL